MFLLDTNVISALRTPSQTHPALRAWAETKTTADLFLSAVTIFEVEFGARRLARRDPVGARVLDTWIATLLLQFEGRILAYDVPAARYCAALHVPDPKPVYDAMIGAIALVHDLTLVTRNVKGFRNTGVRLLNPWDGPA